MSIRKAHFRWSSVCSMLLVTAFSIAPATAQQSLEATPPLGKIESSQPEYVVEFRHFAIPVEASESAPGKTLERLLSKIDAAKIEIQGNGDSFASPPLIMAKAANATQPEPVAPITGTPVLVATLSQAQCNDLITNVKAVGNASVMQGPTATTYANQAYTIFDGSYRPFVTSVKRLKSPDGRVASYQPLIKWVMEGTLAQGLVTEDGGQLRINLKIDCCKVRAVDTIEVAAATQPNTATDEKITLQFPSIDAKLLRISCEITSGDNLLLIPSWEPVQIRPAQAESANPFNIPYVSYLFADAKPKPFDARSAFLVTVRKLDK